MVVRVAPSSPVVVLTTGTVVTGVLLVLPEDVSPSDSVLLLLLLLLLSLSLPEVDVEVKVEDTVVVSLPVVEGVVAVVAARVVVGPLAEKMLRAARLVEGVAPPAAEAAEASAIFCFVLFVRFFFFFF